MVFENEDQMFEYMATYAADLAGKYGLTDLDAVMLINNIKCFMSEYANMLDNGKISHPIQRNDLAALDNINETLGREL